MKDLIAKNAKAIAAAVGSLAAFVAIQAFGAEMPGEVQAGIVSAVAAVLTWVFPNAA